MNYIDRLAETIHNRLYPNHKLNPDMTSLYRIYAVLALTTGINTTNENVHDAWSAWQAETEPEHRSLIPFEQLPSIVQDMDEPYRNAIRWVAWEIKLGRIALTP